MDSSHQDDICVLCCREITIYATGQCDHRVCYECSTRMRVLCDTNECPICRRNMSKVIFTHEPQVFTTLGTQYPLRDKTYNISFEDASIKKAFELLQENKCKICKEIFCTFLKLKEHMRRSHERNFCDLCVDNLKIFTFERKSYTKKDLAIHRRVGDPDDTSLRGHPLCEFCDLRYVDDDALFLHLRRDHYFCHFCDADSLSPFYNDYEDLKVHFRSDHYLCEEDDCAREKFIGAFRSAIDLKAHIAIYHAKNRSKAELKQARTLEVGFTYTSRNNPSGASGFRQNDSRDGRFGQHRKRNIEDNSFSESSNMFTNNNQDAFNTQSTQDFPFLSEDAKDGSLPMPQNNSGTSSNINSFTVQSYSKNNPSYRRNVTSPEDFPALSSASIAVTSEGFNNHNGRINLSVNQRNSAAPLHSSNVSIQLSQRDMPDSNASAAQMSKRNIAKKTPRFPQFQTEDDCERNVSKDKPTWVNKNAAVKCFDEDFPKLAVKEESDSDHENISGLSQFSTPIVPSNVKSGAPAKAKPSGVKVEETQGGPFVTIKCKSKKKKQYKAAAEANRSKQVEENNKAQSSFKLFSSYVSNPKSLDDQENKDPILNIVTTVNLQKPVQKMEDSYWEQKVSFVKEDFPPLEAPEVVKRPPGFDVKVRTSPPGFETKVSEIPSPVTISLSSIARQIALPNQKNNNDKTKSDYAHLTQNCFSSKYSNPPDFNARNELLIERISELANPSKFREFKNLSGNFRQNKISAEQYHTKCLEVLGKDEFLEIFPELVSLLPDINKQNELLAIHNMSLNKFNYMKAASKNNNDPHLFIVCEICSQVLIKNDYASHQFVYHDVTLTNKRK